jgi:precorrin-6Y C5,15-methyltransferase (decarboxylating)
LKVHIVGVGDDGLDGLTSTAQRLIDQAELLLALDPSLRTAVGGKASRLEVEDDVDGVVRRIDENPDRAIVVLASGDPLFYGTARYLCARLGKDRFEVVPHVSSMQLAFARVKESWDEAYLTSLATHGLDYVVEKARTAEKVGLFTTEDATPSVVARRLLDRHIDYFTAYVCENLGSPDERVTQGELAEVADQQFAPPNVMILIRKPHLPDRPASMKGRRLFGNPDEAFLQSKPKRGLLTPAEVRSIALAEMDLGPSSIVWDVGAGSGSVAIECSQIAAGGTVYAIEMNPEDHQLISANAERFGVANLIPVLGRAPGVWADLPDPDAVFVGGAGRQVGRIVEAAFARLRPGGRMVANVGAIENVDAVRKVLHRLAGDARVWMINIAREIYQLERVRFESQNPSFLIAAVKES